MSRHCVLSTMLFRVVKEGTKRIRRGNGGLEVGAYEWEAFSTCVGLANKSGRSSCVNKLLRELSLWVVK